MLILADLVWLMMTETLVVEPVKRHGIQILSIILRYDAK